MEKHPARKWNMDREREKRGDIERRRAKYQKNGGTEIRTDK